MSTGQTWDPLTYARNARFVSDSGSPVGELLAPSPGERILDLACGDGALTTKLVELGCEVVGVDSSAAMRCGDNAFGAVIRQQIEETTKRSCSIGALYTTIDRLESKV